MDRRFFHRLGASRLDRTICSAAGGAGLMHTLGFKYGTEPEQFRHSKLIIAWGANILATNVHLWPFIVEARRNGARFYTIDPVLQPHRQTGRQAFRDLSGQRSGAGAGLDARHHRRETCTMPSTSRITPTDFEELAAAGARVSAGARGALTGIPREDVVTLAREYATTRPAAIRLNYGVQRSERGGAATRAIAALPALTGSWREVGGGLQLSTSQAFQFNRPGSRCRSCSSDRRSAAKRASSICPSWARRSPQLDDPPVKAMVVYNSNPGGHRSQSESGAGGNAARGSVHRGAGTVSDRHRRSRRHPAARRRRSWNTPISISPTGITMCSSRVPRCPRPAKRNRTWKSSGCSPGAWASTSRVSAIPKTT